MTHLPTFEKVVVINLRQYQLYGGTWTPPDNLKNPEQFRGILDYIQDPPFDDGSFSGVLNKAARYGWHIIRNHYFHDGNKRTGMHVLLTVLLANGYKYSATDKEIEDVGLRIADQTRPDSMTLDDLRDWVHAIVAEE